MAGRRDKKGGNVVIIRKVDDGDGGGGHGGAWKVAYADFVTAMMAFFLLMWLLNATTEDQRKGLADYFSPNSLLSHASSGTGQPFGGHTAFDEGAMVSDRGSVEITEGKRPPLNATQDGDPQVFTQARKTEQEKDADPETRKPPPVDTSATPSGADPRISAPAPNGDRPPTQQEIQAEKERQEKAAFEKAAAEIRAAVHDDPALADLASQLKIDMTPEGLRIQVVDEVMSPMFATGSAAPNDRARALLLKVMPVLQRLPERISIAGYTDAAPYAGAGKTNWELSADRANATRRLLTDAGLADTRIQTVTGHADRDPLLPDDPLAAANRRIAIVVLRDAQPAAAPRPITEVTPSGTTSPADAGAAATVPAAGGGSGGGASPPPVGGAGTSMPGPGAPAPASGASITAPSGSGAAAGAAIGVAPPKVGAAAATPPAAPLQTAPPSPGPVQSSPPAGAAPTTPTPARTPPPAPPRDQTPGD